MENKISHIGIVESVDGECVKVRIVQSSACASCKAAKQCNASESKEKIVDVFTGDAPEYEKGQNVTVMASYDVGLVAVCLSMLVPLALITVVLFSMTAMGFGEMTTALVTLSSLVPYYIILFLFRKQINRKVTFGIEKL